MWLRVVFLVFTTLKLFDAQNATKECDKDVSDYAYGDRRTSESTENRRLYDPETFDMMDDMIMPKELKKQLFDKNADNRRNAVKDEDLLWPNKTVPFFIDRDFDKTHRLEILKGIDMIESASCIKFVEMKEPPKHASIDHPYVHINSIRGCYSNVGSLCGRCQMSMDIKNGCFRPGTVAHEFLHVLGFFHMQNAAGRGDYVEIVRENIKENLYRQFEEFADKSTLLGTEYDYDSIMHYGSKFFSINGGFTIKTKDPKYQEIIGQRSHLSSGDITRLKKLYKC